MCVGHVEDVMRTSLIITAKPDDQVSTLLDKQFTGFPVLDQNSKVVGVISQKVVILYRSKFMFLHFKKYTR